MKILYTMLVGLLLIMPACNRGDDRVRAASGERATEEMKDQRDRYISAVDAKLAEFDQKFDGLDARARAMTGAAKDGFKADVDRLRDQRKVVSIKLDDMKKVSVNSWMTLKGEVDAAISELEHSYEQVSASHETVPAAAPKNR